jgi:hypothetical protein
MAFLAGQTVLLVLAEFLNKGHNMLHIRYHVLARLTAKTLTEPVKAGSAWKFTMDNAVYLNAPKVCFLTAITLAIACIVECHCRCLTYSRSSARWRPPSARQKLEMSMERPKLHFSRS